MTKEALMFDLSACLMRLKRLFVESDNFFMNKYHALFIITLINREKYKYSYGRAVYSDESANITIKLPAKNEGGPDWIFMEKFIKSLPYSRMI